jgi:hypothetical protein
MICGNWLSVLVILKLNFSACCRSGEETERKRDSQMHGIYYPVWTYHSGRQIIHYNIPETFQRKDTVY